MRNLRTARLEREREIRRLETYRKHGEAVIQIRFSHPKSKLEALCHRCAWSWHEWDLIDVRHLLFEHLATHFTEPREYQFKAADAPGQGAGCNG